MCHVETFGARPRMSAFAGSGHPCHSHIIRPDCVIAERRVMVGWWLQPWVALIVLAALLAIIASMQARTRGTDDLAALNKRISELYSAGKFGGEIPLAEK